MKTLLLASLLTSIFTATDPPKDYCAGFPTCTFDQRGIYFDLSNDLWARTRAITIRDASEAYCADYPGAKVYVDLGSNIIEGTCEVN